MGSRLWTEWIGWYLARVPEDERREQAEGEAELDSEAQAFLKDAEREIQRDLAEHQAARKRGRGGTFRPRS